MVGFEAQAPIRQTGFPVEFPDVILEFFGLRRENSRSQILAF